MSDRPEYADDVRAGLAALGAPRMPDDVAARIAAALAEEQRREPTAPVTVLPAGRSEPCVPGPSGSRPRLLRAPGVRSRAAVRGTPGRRRSAVLAGLVAAAVAAVAAVTVTAGAPPAPRVVSEEGDLRAAGAGAVGTWDAGPLTDPSRRRACLVATGVPEPGAALLGGRPYAVRGEPGTLLVLGAGVRGRFRLVVVDPACGAGGGRLLASTTAGR